MEHQDMHLKWDDFRPAVLDSLWALLGDEALVDCTLVCSPTESIRVHRLILSANSPYFKSLLSSYPHSPNPIIILQDVNFKILKDLVTFMYRGEITVSPEEMAVLLRTAENLQIQGLSQVKRLSPPVVPSEVGPVYSKKSRILEYGSESSEQPLELKKEEGTDGDGSSTPMCLRYCCIYCSQNFPSSTSLSRHVLSLHPSIYYSESEGGGGGGGGGGSLPGPSTSTAVIGGPPPAPPDSPGCPSPPLDGGDIVCKFCSKPFAEVALLIQHLPVHTGERPFKCEFCGKAFKLRHHMKDHARVHTGERPFKCPLCGKTFSRSTILKAHEKTHYKSGS